MTVLQSATMLTDQTENSLLDRIQSGYRAGQGLRKIYDTAEAILHYTAAKCQQLSVRYYNNIHNNAFDAAIWFTGKTGGRVDHKQFEQKFKQYFEEQLLIFCYRKQSPSQQTATSKGLAQLFETFEEPAKRKLMIEFSELSNDEIKDLIQEATLVVFQRLKDASFKLTSSLKTFHAETIRHMALHLMDEKNNMRKSVRRNKEEREADYQHELYVQQIVSIAQQYIREKSSPTCQAFLEVYWQLKSPFDFIDPNTHQSIREELVKERLELTDDQLIRLKEKTIKLTQAEALQLVSGKKPRKQKANAFYQDCISDLLYHIGEQVHIPLLIKESSRLTPEQEGYVAEFKKLLAKWMRTARTN